MNTASKKIDSTEKTGSHRFQKAININGFAQWFYVFTKKTFEEPEEPDDSGDRNQDSGDRDSLTPNSSNLTPKSASDFENKIVSSEDFETDETPPPKIYIASNDEPEPDKVEDDNFEWWNPKSFPTLAAFEKYQRDKYCRENNCYWDDDLKDFVQLE